MAAESEKEIHVLDQFANDESLLPLMQESFDPKSFATQTIQSHVVGEMLSKLTQGITELDNELYSQVVNHYEDLLSQATGIEALESVLVMMRTRIDSLTTAVDRISVKIVDPYQKMVTRTDQLSRLQCTCDLLRRVIRILYLVKRLKTQVQAGAKEITKVAQTFNEIDQLMKGQDLKGIEVLDEERAWLQRARKETESQAKKMLLIGLEHLNPSQVGVALQVFNNLGQLDHILVSVLTSYSEAVQHEIQNSVDPSYLLQSVQSATSVGGPLRTVVTGTGSGSSTWKASLWVQLEKLSNSLWKLYRQSYQLKVVLAKKRDPVTQISFLVSLDGTEGLSKLNGFWDNIVNLIGIELSTAAKASLPLYQTFESEYPKLIHVFSSFLSQVDKLHQETDEQQSNPASSFLYPQPTTTHETQTSQRRQESLLKALHQFEKLYVSRLFSRLSDSVNQLFTGTNLPKENELNSFVRLLAGELQSAGQCAPLGMVLATNVSKVVAMFNAKCECLVMSGRDSVQVSAPPTSAQLKNVSIVNTLHRFQTLLEDFVLNSVTIGKVGLHKMQDTVKAVSKLKTDIIKPFTTEVTTALEKMVASMHLENYAVQTHIVQNDRRDSVDVPSSEFVKEMMSFTSRIYQDHFSLFNCQDDIKILLKSVVGRVLDIYIRHVCMLRPLTDGGKMKITSDMTQLELALIPFCSKLAEVGEPHRMIRSLRRILFLAPDNFSSQPAGVGDIIPYSYILYYLFSRAPAEMKSPHQLKNWSPEEYIQWVDKHSSEKERLAFIKVAVDSYLKKTRGARQNHPPSIVKVMQELLQLAQSTLG